MESRKRESEIRSFFPGPSQVPQRRCINDYYILVNNIELVNYLWITERQVCEVGRSVLALQPNHSLPKIQRRKSLYLYQEKKFSVASGISTLLFSLPTILFPLFA